MRRKRKPIKRRHKPEPKAFYERGWFLTLLVVVLFYLFVAWTTYRFRHPDQTETELFLHLVDALLWR